MYSSRNSSSKTPFSWFEGDIKAFNTQTLTIIEKPVGVRASTDECWDSIMVSVLRKYCRINTRVQQVSVASKTKVTVPFKSL